MLAAEKFHDAPMAMVAIQVGDNKSELKYLVDSGSTFNLCSHGKSIHGVFQSKKMKGLV